MSYSLELCIWSRPPGRQASGSSLELARQMANSDAPRKPLIARQTPHGAAVSRQRARDSLTKRASDVSPGQWTSSNHLG